MNLLNITNIRKENFMNNATNHVVNLQKMKNWTVKRPRDNW